MYIDSVLSWVLLTTLLFLNLLTDVLNVAQFQFGDRNDQLNDSATSFSSGRSFGTQQQQQQRQAWWSGNFAAESSSTISSPKRECSASIDFSFTTPFAESRPRCQSTQEQEQSFKFSVHLAPATPFDRERETRWRRQIQKTMRLD